MRAARAGESRATADEQRVFSQRLPQVNLTGSYSRTLASEFSGAFSASGPVCAPLTVDPAQPLIDRVAELERAASCGALASSGLNFRNLPFGQRNIYQFGFSFTQAIYDGGRTSAQQTEASASHRIASLTTSTAEAQVSLQAAQAFYDAALADRMVAIAESVFAQADAAYEQARLAYEAGRQPEFEVLRAQVSRDNERPAVIRRRADRDIAYVRLRQLLELPPGTPITLDVNLDAPDLPPPAPLADALAAAPTIDTGDYAATRQSAGLVNVREAAVAVARAERMPAVNVDSTFTRVGYPSSGPFPGPGDFRTNWSVAASVQVPVFTGGRLRADERSALADLAEAQAQLKQAQELATLDATTAGQNVAAARAVWDASAGTVEQAQRAYQIAELRNREGLSTQLELSDARVALEVAQANRAQAARDLQVARARAALLPHLPAGTP